MKNSEYLVNDWSREVFAIEKVNSLQQEILKTPCETRNASEALCKAYETLTDEQKIAFILAGGVPSLFQWQQYHIQDLRTGSDTETGQLPCLC
jgi:hypothetical protein